MRRSLSILLIFAALAATVPAQTLSDSEKVALVFPFEVGQEYEFMAGDTVRFTVGNTFYYHSGPTERKLPPYTVATVSITDTVADGKRYFHIPFWSLGSPFLGDHYRLDDSLRIWVGCYYSDYVGGWSWYETLFMNLNHQWLEGDGYFCYWDFYMYDPFPWCWCSAHNPDGGTRRWGWMAREDRPMFRMLCLPSWDDQDPARWVGEMYLGAYGPGSSLHAAGVSSAQYPYGEYTFGGYLGLFRPRSGDPWPEFVTYRTATRVTGVREDRRQHRPESLSLMGYPNPFNATVTLRYAVPVNGFAALRIYNLAGQLVRTVVEDRLTAGSYAVVWDGRDKVGRQVASGPYLARLVTGDHSTTTRVTLIR